MFHAPTDILKGPLGYSVIRHHILTLPSHHLRVGRSLSPSPAGLGARRRKSSARQAEEADRG